MSRRVHYLLVVALVAGAATSLAFEVWGFYAHREINRHAVYTLPAELAGFYKSNIEFVSEHAVDPDKRRYAASMEGPRHFIDMERFGDGKVSSLPRDFASFHDKFTALYCVQGGDSTEVDYVEGFLRVGADSVKVREYEYAEWYRAAVMRNFYRENAQFEAPWPAAVRGQLPRCTRMSLYDTAMQHGVLPYHLQYMQRRLTDAFRDGKYDRALQLSAEIGHYIGDATVPLHTTENYNGQLTGQRGIHAFWESRIPELFAETDFDLLVGGASYIADKPAFYFELIESSHELVDSVLLIEADLRRKTPEEQITCYEERLGRIIRIPCRSFTEAYYDRLDGMVEERFRTAIRSVGSAWYTAWVDAGKPKLDRRVSEATLVADTTYTAKPGLDGRGH